LLVEVTFIGSATSVVEYWGCTRFTISFRVGGRTGAVCHVSRLRTLVRQALQLHPLHCIGILDDHLSVPDLLQLPECTLPPLYR
jgi:hypothetical protein